MEALKFETKTKSWPPDDPVFAFAQDIYSPVNLVQNMAVLGNRLKQANSC